MREPSGAKIALSFFFNSACVVDKINERTDTAAANSV